MNAFALTHNHTPVELRSFAFVQPRFLLTFSAQTPIHSTVDFAAHCMVLAQNIRKHTVVVFERSMFEGCIEKYATPILEDVSGLKAGVDFWVALKHNNQVAYTSFVETGVQDFLEAKTGGVILHTKGIRSVEQEMLHGGPKHPWVQEKYRLLNALNKAGFVQEHTKILIQGTGLQGLFGHHRRARLKAIQNVLSLYSDVELHDPYVEDECELNALGIHLTRNFSGNYAVVLNLSDAPVFKFYDAEFYKGICSKCPVILNLY
jgi:UDP-N-acetyl-D-mannosaminuronate dehydrogenase